MPALGIDAAVSLDTSDYTVDGAFVGVAVTVVGGHVTLEIATAGTVTLTIAGAGTASQTITGAGTASLTVEEHG